MCTVALITYYLHDVLKQRLLCIFFLFWNICFFIGYAIVNYTLGNCTKFLIDFSLLPLQIFDIYFVFFYIIPLFDRQKKTGIPDFLEALGISAAKIFWLVVMALIILLLFFTFFAYLFALFFLKIMTSLYFFYLLPAFLLIGLEGLLLTCFALMASLYFSQHLTYFLVTMFYVISHVNQTWLMFVEKKMTGIQYCIALFFYYLIPDATIINYKEAVIYQLSLPALKIFAITGYILIFCFIALIFARIAFEKK